MAKKIIFIIFIVLISGISGIIADRFLFPQLASSGLFQRYQWLKRSAESITVINKTEQVYIKEDSTISKAASQAAASVVQISSFVQAEAKPQLTKISKSAAQKVGIGIIATSDGLIMTYAGAIIPDKANYKITVSDGSIYDGELLGIDSYSNLAFLKISASNLSAASLGNSVDEKPGDKVVAIGVGSTNEVRLDGGILSAFDPAFNISNTSVSSSEKLEGVFISDFIRSEAYIGGPLLDYNGQMVGIVGSATRDNTEMFFQIPVNKIKPVLDLAINRKLGNRPVLGIYYLPITKSYAAVFNTPIDRGALIYSASGQQGLAVISGSSASVAGLILGDIIIAVNGQEISLSATLPDLLSTYARGELVELTLLRNGQEMKAMVNL